MGGAYCRPAPGQHRPSLSARSTAIRRSDDIGWVHNGKSPSRIPVPLGLHLFAGSVNTRAAREPTRVFTDDRLVRCRRARQVMRSQISRHGLLWARSRFVRIRLPGAGVRRTVLVCVGCPGGDGHQLRGRRQVPVGVSRVDVTEVGRQQRQRGLSVLPCGVGVEHGANREAVPSQSNWHVSSNCSPAAKHHHHHTTAPPHLNGPVIPALVTHGDANVYELLPFESATTGVNASFSQSRFGNDLG